MIALAVIIVFWLGFLSVEVMELRAKNKDLLNIVKALSIDERSRDKGKTKPNKPRANRPTPAIGKNAPRQR